MSKSGRLRLSDVREVFRLVGDCRDLGADRAAWVGRALEGLRSSLSAYVVIGGFLPTGLDASIVGRSTWDVGWASGRDRDRWLGLLAAGRPAGHATVRGMFEVRRPHVVRSRSQLVADRDWRRSAEFQEDRRPLDQDDTLIGLYRPTRAGLQMFSVNRAVGETPFDGRDRTRLQLFQSEIAGLLETHLAVDEEPSARHVLPPRLIRIARALVEGDSEKQAAARLGLSRHTVHEYVKELHRRLGASNRAELISAWHRLNRPPSRPT